MAIAGSAPPVPAGSARSIQLLELADFRGVVETQK